MRTLEKTPLNHADETFRVIHTMLKKMKMGKKKEELIIAEAVSDILWLVQILPYDPMKYSIVTNQEEIAKLIFYVKDLALVIHDLYVGPRHRKIGLAKSLLVEAMGACRIVPDLIFQTRETNKPVQNLVKFFANKFEIPDSVIHWKKIPAFYIDGGNAWSVTMPNPANWIDQREVQGGV